MAKKKAPSPPKVHNLPPRKPSIYLPMPALKSVKPGRKSSAMVNANAKLKNVRPKAKPAKGMMAIVTKKAQKVR